MDESHFPKYIFGLHDPGGHYLMVEKNKQGWVLVTEELGADPTNLSSSDYTYLSDLGLGVIVRLNYGYGDKGTIPHSSVHDGFAQRCGNFVAGSRGCHIWIIGNEPNLSHERPGGLEVITPELYARCYRKCRDDIRSRPGHENDQVVVAAVGPWNAQTTYPTNWSGNWIRYFTDVLHLLEGQCDGIALHTYTKGYNLGFITGDFYPWKNHPSPDLHNLRDQFRCYIDFMEAIPHSMRHLPVYITETDQDLEWRTDEHAGWVQAAYAEIDRWNQDPSHQAIQALILYRWEVAGMGQEKYSIVNRPGVQEDFKEAIDHNYRVRLPSGMKARGIDVSSHQGRSLDWGKIRGDGISFAFLRATIGFVVDDAYVRNHRCAGEAGILRGAYHYLYAFNPKQQAQLFAETLLESELPPVLDVEQAGLTETHVRTFLDEFERLAGRKAMIYTSMFRWHEIMEMDTPWAREHDLWVAHWTNAPEPLLVQPWRAWTFWQSTSEGQVSGYDGHIDMNYFNGDEAALRDYAYLEPPTLEERVAMLEAKTNQLWATAQERGWPC